ncbi:MAG: exonuclease domain-containing protein [Polaromonas sp.]|nr:exonuclease domain-containing protein [Polaromonas sp.]
MSDPHQVRSGPIRTGNVLIPEGVFADVPFAVIDTETTGVVPGQDKIVEVAVVVIRGREIRTFHSLVNPGIPIPPQASAVHHITDDMVRSSPTLPELASTLSRMVEGAVVVAHHRPFDEAMLAAELGEEVHRWSWICSCRLARHLLPGSPSYGNQVLRYWLKTQPQSAGLGAHRALDDAYATVELVKHELVEAVHRGVDSVAALRQLADSPVRVHVMPFGAHEGERLSDVPRDYFEWALGRIPGRKGLSDLDPDLRWSMEQVLDANEAKKEPHAAAVPPEPTPEDQAKAMTPDPVVFDFGREHRGKPLPMVPTGYLQWMVDTRPRCTPELMRSVEEELKRRNRLSAGATDSSNPSSSPGPKAKANLVGRTERITEDSPPWEDPPAAVLIAASEPALVPLPSASLPIQVAPAWGFHVDGSLPGHRDEVFVFGSNLAGRHGKGAALVARERFGAVPGLGLGAMGQSYAIPTKHVDLKILSLDTIAVYVQKFLEQARKSPHQRFFVTRIGCGLALYSDAQIAPMFARAPANCSFAEEWRPHLLRALGLLPAAEKVSAAEVQRKPRARSRRRTVKPT